MTMQKKQGKTSRKHPTTQIPVSNKHDYITVVGASHMDIDEKIKDFFGSDARGNEMRFINQGIRQIREYPQTTSNFSNQRVFLIFIEGYPRTLLNKVKTVVEGYGAAYRELDDISHFINFVNARVEKKRFVKQIDIFSHGFYWSIEFGYSSDKKDTYRFTAAHAAMLKQEAFEYDAVIKSYACRTGLGIDAKESLGGRDPCYDKSLAQNIADAADVEVWAYPRRSNYDGTYGNAAERRVGREKAAKVKAYDEAMRQYYKKIESYNARLESYRKSKDPKAKQLPGEPPPTPPPKPCGDKDAELGRHEYRRNDNMHDIDYPLDNYGAIHPVRSGDSPTGLPAGHLRYTPRAWRKK